MPPSPTAASRSASRKRLQIENAPFDSAAPAGAFPPNFCRTFTPCAAVHQSGQQRTETRQKRLIWYHLRCPVLSGFGCPTQYGGVQRRMRRRAAGRGPVALGGHRADELLAGHGGAGFGQDLGGGVDGGHLLLLRFCRRLGLALARLDGESAGQLGVQGLGWSWLRGGGRRSVHRGLRLGGVDGGRHAGRCCPVLAARQLKQGAVGEGSFEEASRQLWGLRQARAMRPRTGCRPTARRCFGRLFTAAVICRVSLSRGPPNLDRPRSLRASGACLLGTVPLPRRIWPAFQAQSAVHECVQGSLDQRTGTRLRRSPGGVP